MVADRIGMAEVPRLRDQPAARRASSPGRGSAISCSPRATHAIRLEETKHVDRLYFPVDDVHWEHFEPSLNFTICPFKGAATYWSLTAVDPVEKDIVWTYTKPFDEVAGIEGYVAFYQERVRIELEEHWPGDDTRRDHHQPVPRVG